MRKIASTLALALALVSAPALAAPGGIPGAPSSGGSAGVIAGAVTGSGAFGNAETGTFNSSKSSTFNANGSVVGSSASGFQMDVTGAGTSIAAFGSFGQASSQTNVTPFSVSTESDHVGAFAGGTFGQATLDGSVQTFGQSNGAAAFSVTETESQSSTVTQSSFETGNVGFAVAGAFGFADF